MKRFIQGDNRNQGTLFPEHGEDYVAENNPVRVVDAFVEQLNLGKLGFNRAEPAITVGRPAIRQSSSSFISTVTSTESSPAAVWSGRRNATSNWCGCSTGWHWTLKRLPTSGKTMARPSVKCAANLCPYAVS